MPTPPAPANRAAVPSPIAPRDERRASARVDAEFEVTFQSETQFYNGFSGDISEGGLFVATYETRPVGTRLHVQFTLPGVEAALTAECEVRWLRAPRPGSDAGPGMGLRFVDLDPTARAAVERFVRKREPLFYDA